MVTALCSTSYDVCGPSGITTAVTKTRCLLMSDATTTKIPAGVCENINNILTLFGKSAVECYKSLKECVRTLASS
jgi:hypothetical protein